MWVAQPSDGVSLSLRSDVGQSGQALRLDFDFHSGGGYAVARRVLPLVLPENYQFTFWIQADAPVNNLEFKLIDPSGENVWWVNRRDFEFPRAWTLVTLKKRHIGFAWGPRGGGEMDSVAAIELAVTAGSGGRGTVWIDELAITMLEPAREYDLTPVASASTSSPEDDAAWAIDGDTTTSWRVAPGEQWLQIDFLRSREFGGLVLKWEGAVRPVEYRITASLDKVRWDTLYTTARRTGARDYIFLPESEARWLRLDVIAARGAARRLREVEVKPLSWAPTRNDFFAAIARDAPRGAYPRYVAGEASYWTVVGVDGDSVEALINTDGAVEVGKRAFSIEPVVRDDRLYTWSDVTSTVWLEGGYLPIPSVRWQAPRFSLQVTAFVAGSPGSSILYVRYRVRGDDRSVSTPALTLVVRPFQVNPSYQFLNNVGGVTRIDSVRLTRAAVVVNGRPRVVPLVTPSAAAALTFDHGNPIESLRNGSLPSDSTANDPFGHASAVLSFSNPLAPGAERVIDIAVPLHGQSPSSIVRDSAEVSALLTGTATEWRDALNRVRFEVPLEAQQVVNTLRSNLAYILINRDGPAIQPGSRAYERSWIRDGSLTSAALLRMGHAETARSFIEWFAPHQYPSGKVPCCVDARGADPVPEHDSHGQLIYAIAEYWRFTRDRGFLARLWPHVARAVAYIDSLRQQRLTDEYRAPDKRAFYGLLPPSISHEGYSAKPMHSYWDDFFALKGLKDAVSIAEALGRREDTAGFTTLRDAFRKDLLASFQAAMAMHRIDFLPGAADLGDFDATSTTVGITPVGELASLPGAAVTNTFERYYEDFVGRRDRGPVWDAFTPYELRVVGTFIRLGQKQRAHELLDFFFQHQRPRAWNHWAEVVWRDPALAKFIGDMPHTWVGSDYIRSVLDMFAYERDEDDALVVAPGIPESWVTRGTGIAVQGLPTYYGPLTFSMRGTPAEVAVRVERGVRPPQSGIIVRSPFDRPIREAVLDGRVVPVAEGREVRLGRVPATLVLRY